MTPGPVLSLGVLPLWLWDMPRCLQKDPLQRAELRWLGPRDQSLPCTPQSSGSSPELLFCL